MIRVGTIENYYGGLVAKEENGKYYWGIEGHAETVWQQIPESLYKELITLKDTNQ